jgi:NADH dehydrogenase FAD-containing subunit
VAGIFERICGERGIDLVLGDAAKSVSGGFVHTEAGRKIPADEVVWCTSAGEIDPKP